MIITSINYSKYGGYEYLLNEFTEPLFLKPDGVRTRYPIGWNGYGRYMPGSLKVSYKGTPCNITEEENGIFYNFNVAPTANTNYSDYEIDYVIRPLDYAFSTGLPEGGYEGEEYFLFPNWNNALGEGDGFWIGKWEASNNGNNIPQSKPNTTYLWTNITRDDAIEACKSKGSKFGMVTNREWVSIARWCDHHDIHVKGNIYGRQINNLDGDYTSLDSCGGGYIGGYISGNGYYYVIGTTFPDNWNHNGKNNGIHNMIGNIFEFIDGLENRRGEIYIYDENNNYTDSGVSVSNNNSSTTIVDITNTNEDILNEGIPNTVGTNGYIPSNLDSAYAWYINSQTNTLGRGGSSCNGLQCGLWMFDTSIPLTYSGWDYGFRLSRKLV